MRHWLLMSVGVVVVLALLTRPASPDAGRFSSPEDLAEAAGCERTRPLLDVPWASSATSCRLTRGQNLRIYWFDAPDDRERYEGLGNESGLSYLSHDLWLVAANRPSTLRRVQDRVGGTLSRPWLGRP